MAVNFKTVYGTLAGGPSAAYPLGFGINETIPGAGDGSPFEAIWFNDWMGLFQKLLTEADIAPSGDPDTAIVSDYFNALSVVFGREVKAVADLRVTVATTDGQPIGLMAHSTQGDGGGGEFYWNATSVLVDDDKTVIKVTSVTTGRWIRTKLPATTDSIASLRAISMVPESREQISVLSYWGGSQGGGGVFYWSTGDLSSEVAADPKGGVYVAPTYAPSGASGAFVRKDRRVIDPRNFGAVDGILVDDGEAFEAALNYASIVRGTVLIPYGDFRTNRSLYVKEGVTFQSLGGTLTATVSGASIIYIKAEYTIDRNFDSHVKDLILINDGSTAGAEMKHSAAISFYGDVINPGTNGDQVTHTGETKDNSITGNTIKGFTVGLYLGSNTFVGRSYIHTINKISGCVYNVYMDDKCEYTTLANNRLQAGTYGVYDNGASNCSLLGNQINNNSEAGVYLATTGRNTKKFIITTNHINHNKRGVWIGGGVGDVGIVATECLISNNHILANTSHGVVLTGGTDISILSNIFSGNDIGGAEVHISAPCYRIAVKDNEFENTVGTLSAIQVIGKPATPGVETKAYHAIKDNKYKGYAIQIDWVYPSGLPLDAANSIINGVFEYWNTSGLPPAVSAGDPSAGVDLQYIPDGTVCSNNATVAGEYWMKLTRPGSFDSTHETVKFRLLP